ncbi:DUF3137 domain-containing protein [Terricaulis sp.]|uniref:DUF3137 domain-containing protein n=1 Tax=Terricaulis sp. TaxID=2768686 RepID=UPI00378463BE
MTAESPNVDFANLDDATFARLYAERIEPCFHDNEDERIAAVASYKQRLMIGIPAVLAVAAVAWFWSREFWFAFFAIVFLGVIAFAIAYAPLAAVGKKVKQAYCAAIAEAMGASFTMGGFSPPALERMKHLRLLPGYSRSSFEDLFSGSYRECPFDLYEAHLEQRHTDSKGRTRYSTVFRGQLVRMHFPRKFLGITVVRRDAGVFNVFGGGLGLKRVGLEDPLFEKAFEVWGNDQVEARYILHPVLMQRLLDLETRLKGKRLRCAFEDGELLVAVEGGNLFEPGDLFKPLVDQTRARRIVDEIASVVRVMEQVITAQARR